MSAFGMSVALSFWPLMVGAIAVAARRDARERAQRRDDRASMAEFDAMRRALR